MSAQAAASDAGGPGPAHPPGGWLDAPVLRHPPLPIEAPVRHARGSAAHGQFRVYACEAGLTRAAFLQDPAAITPAFVQFSAVAGSRGAADLARRPCDFTIRLHTAEGECVLPGSNLPMGLGGDARAVQAGMPSAGLAHERFWHAASRAPETMPALIWLMSDRALPRSLRMTDGASPQVIRLRDAAGAACFVTFHWQPLLGVHALTAPEARALWQRDPDFHRRDLWEAINDAHVPEWELGIRVITGTDRPPAAFDRRAAEGPTAVAPVMQPIRWIGRLTLNRNVGPGAAAPAPLPEGAESGVPGLDIEPGASVEPPCSDPLGAAARFYSELAPWEQAQLAQAFQFELGALTVPTTVARVMGLLQAIDPRLGDSVAEGLGSEPVPTRPARRHALPAPARSEPLERLGALRQPRSALPTQPQRSSHGIPTRRIAVLAADGVDLDSVHALQDALLAAGAASQIVAPRCGRLSGFDGRSLRIDHSLPTTGSVMFDAVFVPGGAASIETLLRHSDAVQFIHEAYWHFKTIGAHDDGCDLADAAGVEAVFKDRDEADPGVVMSRSAGIVELAADFIAAVARHRHWARDIRALSRA